jgi:hypothetical protein
LCEKIGNFSAAQPSHLGESLINCEKTLKKGSNMNQKSINPRSIRKSARILLAIALTGFSAARVWAQGDSPSGTISGSGTGPSYTYNLTFSDSSSATSPIGSIWYGWLPPYYNYLPGVPSTASGALGWSAAISANSIEFYATSPTYDIQPGHSLSGFSYTASYSPSTLAGDSAAAYSDAYTAGIESDNGVIFTVTTVVPEPSLAALSGIGALGLAVARWRRLRVSK